MDGTQRWTGTSVWCGSSSGTRIVVNRYESAQGHVVRGVQCEDALGRSLLVVQPGDFEDVIRRPERFDEVRREAITFDPVVRAGATLEVRSASVQLTLRLGARHPYGHLLGAVPRPIRTSPAWGRALQPLARSMTRATRTTNPAAGRDTPREDVFIAQDLHRVAGVSGRIDGRDVGSLAPFLPIPAHTMVPPLRDPMATQFVLVSVAPS